ncbi:hypothetical protein HAX54_035510, partial [Datura stramonium]|nr:hypothetical protein [Datura stramonium]
LNQMVNFKDYTSPSSKLKYLIIESSERPAMQTRLLMWSLQSPLHRYTNIASSLPILARCIVQEEIRWGETVVFEGEYCHIPGYGEWAEDTLARSQEALITTDIYDAAYPLF